MRSDHRLKKIKIKNKKKLLWWIVFCKVFIFLQDI